MFYERVLPLHLELEVKPNQPSLEELKSLIIKHLRKLGHFINETPGEFRGIALDVKEAKQASELPRIIQEKVFSG